MQRINVINDNGSLYCTKTTCDFWYGIIYGSGEPYTYALSVKCFSFGMQRKHYYF